VVRPKAKPQANNHTFSHHDLDWWHLKSQSSSVRGSALAVFALALGAGLGGGATGRAETARSELISRMQRLEQRASLAEDAKAIKRLQRAYGYYFDKGLWDDVANLFSDDGTIEIGFDGVYAGKKRVREYLYAYGGGKSGLIPGRLQEHLQLMPVVTVAADGLSAKGTWRDIILQGQLGKEAFWGEGPFENEYIKENGIWKIRRLHWFQTLYVPYAGGWQKHGDTNGGHFVDASMRADAPPTAACKSWPKAFTPPFHFKDASRTPVIPKVAISALPNPTPESLARRVAQLAAGVQRLTDQDAIENLQRIYGFYIDKSQWAQAAALFADDAEIEIAGKGAYRGKDHILAYLRAIGPEGVLEGRLFDTMQLQPIVHVAEDGLSARGRWRMFAQYAKFGEFHEWGTGVYENEYAKQDGVWKIRRLHFYPTMFTPYEDGWGKSALPFSRFEPTLLADAPSRDPVTTYDRGGFVPAFHYAHPVTGSRPSLAHPGPLGKTDAASIATRLDLIEQQLAQVEDTAAIENLQMIYGYYLATLQWDSLAELFDNDGTIEVALRGVYAGKAAVRRNLNLYGQAGLDDGVLHNHMQYQPVIHVSTDGLHAKLRSRAFSMMGNFEKSGQWMGGVYENEFIKVNGLWKFRKDQVMNTYFAPYEQGWKDLQLRPPPGVTDSNPPDRPPSFTFDMYPKGFLPPYHYVNPVTDK
jgi:hypothetical protein